MTVQLRYVPGERFLATGPGLTILSSDRGLVERMWRVIRDSGDPAAVLADALAGGFDSLADLVLVEGGPDRVEILLRGDVDVTVQTAASAVQRLSGRDVRTWRECSAEAVTALRVGATVDPAAELPLRCGIVPAAGFRWEAADTAPGRSAPAHTVEPVPSAAADQAEDGGPSEPHDGSTAPAFVADSTDPPAAPAPPPLSPVPPPPTPIPWPAPPGKASVPPVPITSVPPAGQAAPLSAAADTRLGAGDEFGHLFESTVLRSPEDAAVRTDPDHDGDEPTPEQPEPSAQLGDHDGSTILGSQLAALLAADRDRLPPLPPPPPPPATMRIELVFSTGQVVPLDQAVVVGRKPQVDRVSGSQIPRLITVNGPNNDISRSHLEIRPDTAGVVATDLGSTNGTVVIGPAGSRPLVAHSGEKIASGSRLDLGDGVTIDVRDAR